MSLGVQSAAVGLGVVMFLSTGCAVSSNQAAGAAATTASGLVGAAIYREATGGCWAACRQGFACDEPSGTCVVIPCGGECPPDHVCDERAVEPRCVPRIKERPYLGPEDGEDGATYAPTPASDVDPCNGLCFKDEECVVQDGIADCSKSATVEAATEEEPAP